MKPPPKGWTRIHRLSGLVEDVCPHGVGHPNPESIKIMDAKGPPGARGTWGVHGCCESHCCGKRVLDELACEAQELKIGY